MKLLITCGGTAGHVFPAIAFAEKIRSKNELFFVGGARLEKTIIPKHNFDFIEIPVSRKNPFVLAKSLLVSIMLLIKHKPDAVFATGGYVTCPVLMSCIILKKPFFIHEQNLLPGRLNRLFSKKAKRVFISFENSSDYFKNSYYSGNPVRESIIALGKNKNYSSTIKTVLIFGGSLGSKSLNKLAKGLQAENKFKIIHIDKYKDNIEEDYQKADLVVCRAGATSITEILALGVPSILVPYPLAKDNHQEYNAQELVYKNLAFMINDQDLSVARVAEIISNKKILKETITNLEQNKKTNNLSKIPRTILTKIKESLA